MPLDRCVPHVFIWLCLCTICAPLRRASVCVLLPLIASVLLLAAGVPLDQIKAKVALWASKIGQDIERFQVSQRKRRGRARQDLVGIFQILNSRSHYQIIQQYGENGVYRRMHRRQPKLGNDEAKPDKKLPRAEELDPEVKAEMLLESLNARQDLGLTLDRLYARVSALTDLTFGVQLAAKINDMVATVAEVRTRQAQLDDQVTRLRETQVRCSCRARLEMSTRSHDLCSFGLLARFL